jgi:DNA-binding GntR family transcriptional regulator
MRIAKENLDSLAYETLREEILSGNLAQGERLIQEDLAARLGVSRLPVRDALRRLEMDGLIEKSGVGYSVAEFNETNLADIYGIRLRIDGYAAGLCARRATPEVLKSLSRILEECGRAIERSDAGRFTALDREFHQAIYHGADSPQLRKSVHLLWQGIVPIASIRLHPYRMKNAHQEHQKIFEAIQAGDHALAEECARIHVDRAREAVLQKLKDDKKSKAPQARELDNAS